MTFTLPNISLNAAARWASGWFEPARPQSAQKDYDAIWAENAGGFGPPNPEMIGYCADYTPKDVKQASIIDIASGNGRYAIPFAQMGYQYVEAIDISQVGCDLIKLRGAAYPQLAVHQSDLLNYDRPRTFDTVFSSGLLEEFESAAEQVAAVRKMQQMAAPEGLVVLRYCLEISNRNPQQRTPEELVRPLFSDDEWDVKVYKTDPAAFHNGKSTIKDGQNFIRRQTIVARRRPVVAAAPA